MAVNISRPQKIVNNIVYEDNMPKIDSTHASITKITTIKLTGSETDSSVYTVYVYDNTAMFYYDNKFVKFDIQTQTSTVIQFESSISSITGISLLPDLSGIYDIRYSYGTYSMVYFSFEDGSMTRVYDTDYISALSALSTSSFQSSFIGNDYVVYPKHGRMYTNEKNECKVYMSRPTSKTDKSPVITQIASINIGTSKYDRFEIVNMTIDEFKNNKLRYVLLATNAYNLEVQPYGFYNEYDINTQSFWISDKSGLGSPIEIKYGNDKVKSTSDGDIAFYNVPFIYVDPKHRFIVPTVSGGSTVVTVPQRDAEYKSSTKWTNEDNSETVTIIEPFYLTYNKILWGFNYNHGCFRTDKTPNGYYFESYTTAGDNEVGLYYIECID